MSAAAAARHNFCFAEIQHYDAVENDQKANGRIDFSFRKRFEKVDWRKIGTLREITFLYLH